MAIIPTTQVTVARYAAALYGVKLGKNTQSAVIDDVQLVGLNNVLNGYYGPFAAKTSAEVAAIVVANAGLKAGEYGLTEQNVNDAIATVTLALNNAAPFGKQGEAIANMMAEFSNFWVNDAVYGAVAKAWNQKINAAIAHTAGNADDAVFGSVVTEFVLTAAADKVVGSAGDDVIIGNQGALGDADVIDGGAGRDTLKAIVSAKTIAPTIKNVEHLQFQAQHRGTDSGDNNLTNDQVVKVDFNTNVTSVTGFDTIENNNSRADLIIEDVRIADHQITKDITIAMRETDPGNVDFGVYFDQNSLRNASSSASQINLRVLDTYAVAEGKDPLLDSPYGSFTFAYSLDGAAAQTVTLESQAIQDAKTFPAMVAALQAAADAVFGPGGVTVSLGNTYTVPDSVTGKSVQGTEIVLAAKGNIAFSTPAGSGWKATDVVPAISGLHTSYTVGATSSTELVTVNVVLDDVGRGSTGGDLVIGGLSVGETSTSKGVEKFLITVEDNSKLQTIQSTNNTLREVVIVNGTTSRVDNAYNENQKNAGSLSVLGNNGYHDQTAGNIGGSNDASLPGTDGSTVTSKGIHGETTTTGPRTDGEFGFTDVRVVDGSAMTGKLAFDAQITEASIAKYLNHKDTAGNYQADNANFAYSGGSNDDQIAIHVNGNVLAGASAATREDFKLSINGGDGNDLLLVSTKDAAGTGFSNWYADQAQLKNIEIDAGAGNDTVFKVGDGDAKITAGAGNDTVYVDWTDNAKATWAVNAGSAPILNNLLAGTTNVGNHFLYKGQLTATYKGVEVTVDIPTGSNYAVNQYHVNQAIKAAINNSVLSKVLVVEEGPGASLIIKAVSDGVHAAADLKLTVSAPTTVPLAEQTNVLNAYKAFTNNASAAITDAEAATTASVGLKNGIAGMNTVSVLVVVGDASSNLPAAVNAASGATTAAIDFAGITLVEGSQITLDGASVTVAAGETAATLVQKFVGQTFTSGATVAVNATNTEQLDFTFSPALSAAVTLTVASASQLATGQVSTTVSDNIINLGAGDDVVVLGTGADSKDTLVLEGLGLGKDVIFNFATTGTGADKIDLNAYLTSKQVVAGVTQTFAKTVAAVDATSASGQAVEANSIQVITNAGFNETTAKFSDLTAAKFKEVLNTSTATFGNLGNELDAGSTVVVGNTGKAVVFVENNLNVGEYALFELTFSTASTNTTKEFSGVELIGVLDFGATLGTNPALALFA